MKKRARGVVSALLALAMSTMTWLPASAAEMPGTKITLRSASAMTPTEDGHDPEEPSPDEPNGALDSSGADGEESSGLTGGVTEETEEPASRTANATESALAKGAFAETGEGSWLAALCLPAALAGTACLLRARKESARDSDSASASKGMEAKGTR